jgi:hypothetical protein
MLAAATCNIQDSSIKDEYLGHLEYNGYELWMSWLINECRTRIQEIFILIFKYAVCNGAHCNLQLCKFVLCNNLKFIYWIDVPSM